MPTGLRVYLSGPSGAAAMARECAAELREQGHEITSRWHDDGQDRDHLPSMEAVPVLLADIQAVVASDIIVGFIHGGNRDRSLFELGVACHAGLHLHLIGRPGTRGFDLLPTTTRWQTIAHFRRGSTLWPEDAR